MIFRKKGMQKIKQTYTHIVIIGNGFDLNKNLKTRYSDFVNSIEFRNLLNSGNYLVDYLFKKHEFQRWIDIENELKTYSLNQNISEAIINFEQDFSALSNALKTYLKTIKYDDLDEQALSYKLLSAIKDTDFLILDFNYTKTTETILLNLGIIKESIDERLIKVHGSIDEQEIIFGVEDSARIKPQHVFLRKAYNPHFKAININNNLETLNQLYIFGHSIGETDHMYFKSFFRTFSQPHYYDRGKTIVLFHFGQVGYNQLLMQIDELTSNNLSIFKQNNDFKTKDTSKKK